MRDSGLAFAVAVIALLLFAGATVRAWSLLGALALCVVGFFVSGGEALAWLWFFEGLPVAMAIAVAGWAARRFVSRRVWVIPAVVAGVALVVGGVLEARWALRDRVPAAVARQLPPDTGTLGSICEASSASAAERRTARDQIRALAAALPGHEGDVITVHDTSGAEGPVKTEMTLRAFAEQELRISYCSSPEVSALLRALAVAD